MNKTEVANSILQSLFEDMRSRSGFDDFFNGIDKDIMREIIIKWRNIIIEEIENAEN